jgi:hypothetical protein
MPKSQMQLKDVLSPSHTWKVETGEVLGRGAQGEVIALRNGHPGPGEYVLKLYDVGVGTPAGQHLIKLVQFLGTRPALRRESGLALPELVVEERGSRRIGCLLRRAPGGPLNAQAYAEIYQRYG